MDKATAQRKTVSERYEDRRSAYASYLGVATTLSDEALEREYRGHEPPENYVDPPEMATTFRPLETALGDVLLLGRADTRTAATDLYSSVCGFVMSYDGYGQVQENMNRFREAARADLGIEEQPAGS